jgi:hypothetical protein
MMDNLKSGIANQCKIMSGDRFLTRVGKKMEYAGEMI